MSVTIGAQYLHSMLVQVTPHMGTDDTIPVINAIHLEAGDNHLTAIATDRFTLGIARQGVIDDETWTSAIPAEDLPAVTAWAKAAEFDVVTIDTTVEDDDATLTFKGKGGALQISHRARDYAALPSWRKLVRDAITGTPEVVQLSGLTTKYLARWKHADKILHFFQTGPRKPLVFMDDEGDFIGLQMPINNEHTSRSELIGQWKTSLSRRAVVNGEAYSLDVQWADKQGDPWEYTGLNRGDEPLMRLVGIDDDDHTLGELIEYFGPLSPIAT